MFKKNKELCLKQLSLCSLCHHLSSDGVFYVCGSGHTLCGNCRTEDMQGVRLDDGDCLKCKKKKNTDKKDGSKIRSYKTDLASGDFAKSTPKLEFENIDEECCIKKDHKNKVVVTYKNELYQESDTSAGSNENSPERDKVLQECKPVPRPLTCPVCSKMIAVDSILQHFFFDHSKVSRYTLKLQISQPIILKVSELGDGTNCIAVILLESGKSKLNTPLLLMATQIKSSSKHDKRSIKRKDSLTHPAIQTIKSAAAYPKNNEKSNEIHTEPANKEFKESDTDLIVWLCKTVETEVIYSLTVSREDKKRSFSYTGDAAHIRSDQTGTNMFNNSECVIVKSAALKKLVNHIGYLHIFVSILHV